MALGLGVYDELCTLVREQAQARGAIIIVIDGGNGHGFSVQGDLELQMKLPDLLESMAQQIRADVRRLTG